MGGTQHAVFHFDVKTMTMSETTPLVFDSFADAQRHCGGQIQSDPTHGCRIYNKEGKVVQTFSDDRLYAQHHGRPAAKRTVIIGIVCIVVGASSVGLDAWLEWRLIFGVLLGVRFLWVGAVKFAVGISGLLEER